MPAAAGLRALSPGQGCVVRTDRKEALTEELRKSWFPSPVEDHAQEAGVEIADVLHGTPDQGARLAAPDHQEHRVGRWRRRSSASRLPRSGPVSTRTVSKAAAGAPEEQLDLAPPELGGACIDTGADGEDEEALGVRGAG